MKQSIVSLTITCVLINFAMGQDPGNTWVKHLIDDEIDGPRDVEVIDLDGDGDMDILSSAQHSNEIAWWENDGEENFTRHTITNNFNWATGVDASDLDGDGDLDVLGAGHLAHTILWWENDGSENFTQHLIANLTYAVDVIAFDLDEDGDVDAVGSACGNTVVWCENDGNENFTMHTIDNDLFEAGDVNVADVDGDGDYDVLGAATGGDYIAWYENDGNECFTKHTIYSGFDNPDCAYPVDLDGDGDIDVLSAAHYAFDLSWWENDGNQNFSKHVIDNQSGAAYDFHVEDLDGDGDLDVASAGTYTDEIYWYENDGSENFTKHTITSNFDVAIDVYIADIDGDEDMDVVGVASSGDELAWWENVSVGASSIEGTVIPPFQGITIDLLDDTNSLIESVLTDESGNYSFPDLDPGNYIVELIEPLGFQSVSPVPIVLDPDETETVNFELIPIAAINDARSKGYWKHQVNAILSNKSNRDYEESDMLGFAQDILEYFYLNAINPIQVEGVTYTGDPATALGMENLQSLLNVNQGGSTMNDRTCQQFLTFLLNVVSNKLAQSTQASEDGATVSQAIVHIDLLLGTNDEQAKDIADILNQAQMVDAGIIPLTTPNTAFSSEIVGLLQCPYAFRVDVPAPNPFNATAVMQFTLPEATKVDFVVYNVAGQKVMTLIDGWRDAGSHQVTFDGSVLASGVYFYRFTAGQHKASGKMVLMK